MEYTRIRKTQLARNTSQVIRNVLRGQPIVIENHGQPEVAIVDVIDYLILRAVAHFHARAPQLDPNGPSDKEFIGLGSQDRFDRAMAYYLSDQCSTGRAAELMEVPWVDMRERFNRLDVPLLLGPRTIEDAREETNTLLKYLPK